MTAPVRTRWHRRVLPVTGLVLALLAVAALVSPGFRDQVALSVTRQPQPFVELWFTQTAQYAEAGTRCLRDGDSLGVAFTVASHLEEPETLEFQVAVDGAADGAGTQRGSLDLDPGEARDVRVWVTAPDDRAQTVTVRLPALDQELRARCPEARP